MKVRRTFVISIALLCVVAFTSCSAMNGLGDLSKFDFNKLPYGYMLSYHFTESVDDPENPNCESIHAGQVTVCTSNGRSFLGDTVYDENLFANSSYYNNIIYVDVDDDGNETPSTYWEQIGYEDKDAFVDKNLKEGSVIICEGYVSVKREEDGSRYIGIAGHDRYTVLTGVYDVSEDAYAAISEGDFIAVVGSYLDYGDDLSDGNLHISYGNYCPQSEFSWSSN